MTPRVSTGHSRAISIAKSTHAEAATVAVLEADRLGRIRAGSSRVNRPVSRPAKTAPCSGETATNQLRVSGRKRLILDSMAEPGCETASPTNPINDDDEDTGAQTAGSIT